MRGHAEIQKNIEKPMENKEKPRSERARQAGSGVKHLNIYKAQDVEEAAQSSPEAAQSNPEQPRALQPRAAQSTPEAALIKKNFEKPKEKLELRVARPR